MKNNKGFSLLILIVVVAVLGLVAAWFAIYSDSGPALKIANQIRNNDSQDKEEVVFEDIPEDEYTPVEINNEALDELDSIMDSLEDEDLSELGDL